MRKMISILMSLALCLALASPAFAAVPGTSSYQDYTGNGATVAFAFTFPALAVGDVEVLVGGVKQLAGVTVVLNANQATSPGGTATFTAAPANLAAVRIQRTVALTQGLVLQPYSAFPAKTIEKTFDRLVMQAQQEVRDRQTQRDSDVAAQVTRDAGQDDQIAMSRGTNGYASVADTSTVLATGSTTARTLAASAADVANVKGYGAAGVSGDDTASIALALASGKGTVQVPDGTYGISSPLSIPSNVIIQFSQKAKFIALADNLIIFRTVANTFFAQIRDANLDGNGHANVTGFDLSGFRVKSRIDNASMVGMANGIVLRQLCWDVVIDNPRAQNVSYPLIIQDGSNTVDVRHPAFDGGTIGIQVVTGPTYSTTDNRITGGYVQGFTQYGITDSAISTKIDGTYFENNTLSDIYFSSSIRGAASRTGHWAVAGQVAIKGRGSTGVTIWDPTMGNANRVVGLYDFDASNGACTEWHIVTSDSKNLPLGVMTGIASFSAPPIGSSFALQPAVGTVAVQTNGTFTPVVVGTTLAGAGTYTDQAGTWFKTGNVVTFHATVTWTAHTGTGNLVMTGLPVALTPSSFTARRVVSVIPIFAFTGPVVYAYLNGSNTDITVGQVTAAGTASLMPLPASGTLHITGSYTVQ